ncbi:MAG: hypothetical protein B7Y07_10035 [Halothiobacillus sp. 24-54-40]|jgi:hypothetical protein|nr:MAG: hypothetical protein B7Y58_09105 [Halothiobacillus sp. 35-54-62]OYZ85867.1 MAG: hypothetical protein B7Y07_10035 [Halothiobacillus sp. 24-54-40]OZA79198.1 MAG: hypothetical protein B7X64_10785 [Halothiobacillus sp. 39-53-45]HQS03854.1 DUF2442 domain-containing protein [Halothiobacillus sp.]HQS29792.1 DUF2442 domain-containing protein [Halothiobacillus sp.]
MFLHTSFVEPRLGYRLFVRFDNGASGLVDLSTELWGEIFEPLNNEALFMTATQNNILGTVVWANGADFAPEFLYALLQKQTGLAA